MDKSYRFRGETSKYISLFQNIAMELNKTPKLIIICAVTIDSLQCPLETKSLYNNDRTSWNAEIASCEKISMVAMFKIN